MALLFGELPPGDVGGKKIVFGSPEKERKKEKKTLFVKETQNRDP